MTILYKNINQSRDNDERQVVKCMIRYGNGTICYAAASYSNETLIQTMQNQRTQAWKRKL